MKFSTRLAVALGATALAVAGLAAPAQAAPSPSTIYVGGPSGSVSTCTNAASIGVYSDSAHTNAVTTIAGTSGSLSLHNDCANYAIYATYPPSSTASIPGTAFNSGANSVSTLMPSASGTLSIYQCAYVGANPGTAGGCNNAGDRTLATTVILSFPVPASGTILNTANGTVTVTYSNLVGTPSLSLCATSVSVVLCDATTAIYVFDSNVGTGLSSSPAVISSGMSTNTGGTYSATTVADGTYRFVLRDAGNSFAIVSTQSAGTIGGGGGSSSSAPAPTETLSLAVAASGATCTGGNPSGVSGSWLTLPSADQCTQSGPTAKADAKLLGWSTSANFPIGLAQSQVDKHWGVIDETIDGVRMIFIPAGMAVFVSGSNNLYPVWSK